MERLLHDYCRGVENIIKPHEVIIFYIKLRLNCGLVVYYKPTEEFESFSRAISNRVYIELIFGQRIAPLLNSIRFINEEHSKIYINILFRSNV